MKFLEFFRKPSVLPQPEVKLEGLGTVQWSGDDEAWRGRLERYEYFLAFDRTSSVPLPELVEYAKKILLGDWLGEAVSVARSGYAQKHPGFSDELMRLRIESVYFYFKSGHSHIDCQLGYGDPDRFWTVEFRDGELVGIGFDS